jgi:hypothetical protein
MHSETMIVCVVRPGFVSYNTSWSENDRLVLQDRVVEAQRSTWCSSWGILIDRSTDEFCGLSFYVAGDNVRIARRLIADCDRRLINAVDSASDVAKLRYGDLPDGSALVELVWGLSPRLSNEEEVLDEGGYGHWLYWNRDSEGKREEGLFGFLLEGIDWILEDHSVELPSEARLTVSLRHGKAE